MNVGDVIEVQKKGGNKVQRKCVAMIPPEYIEEQKELIEKNGFAPMFVKSGAVWLAMSPASRKTLSDEERARREKEKEARSKAYRDRVAKNKAKREAEALEKINEAKKKLAEREAKLKA